MSRNHWMDEVGYRLNQLRWATEELEDLFEDDEAGVEDGFLLDTIMKLSKIRQRIEML